MAGRGVFVVLVAAGIGLLVLKNGFADGSTGTVSAGTTTSTAPTTTTTPGATTTAAPNPAAAKVLVANGSGISGAAGKVTTFLKGKGFATLPATDATTKNYAETVVYHLDGFQQQAAAVAQQLGGVKVGGLMPNPPPVKSLGDANVLVVVGKKPMPGVNA
jgi:hypothetical protein